MKRLEFASWQRCFAARRGHSGGTVPTQCLHTLCSLESWAFTKRRSGQSSQRETGITKSCPALNDTWLFLIMTQIHRFIPTCQEVSVILIYVPNTTQYSCPKQLHTLRHFIPQNEPLHSGKLIIQSNSPFFPTDSEYSLFFFPMESKNQVIGHSHLVAPSNSSTHTLFYANNWILFYTYVHIYLKYV